MGYDIVKHNLALLGFDSCRLSSGLSKRSYANDRNQHKARKDAMEKFKLKEAELLASSVEARVSALREELCEAERKRVAQEFSMHSRMQQVGDHLKGLDKTIGKLVATSPDSGGDA